MSPKFGELLATDVWAAAARTLTDISAEEIFDLPIADAFAPSDVVTPASAGSIDGFGSWVELIADVGVGKRLVAFSCRNAAAGILWAEYEFGEGESGSEIAVARTSAYHNADTVGHVRPLWCALSDNARLSVRVRDGVTPAQTYGVVPIII